MQLLTIGYEGLTTGRFFDLLKVHEVGTLIDVRELPLSRKRGFSKSALAEAAARYGIGYVHAPALGCPRHIRHEYREDRDWARYTRRFKSHLATQEPAIAELANRVRREQCCLMCFEADPNFCHRLYVAERVVQAVRPRPHLLHINAPVPALTAQAALWAA